MYVLGLSFYYHDAAAALVKDGVLVAAAEEERFSRRKHDSEFPERAVRYCLDAAGITIDQVDYIGFYEKPFVKFIRILETCLAGWPRTYMTWARSMPLWLKSKIRVGSLIQEKLGTDRDIVFCEHHLSHAASAFLVSPFEEAVLLTMDGVGEWTTTAFGTGRGSAMTFDGEIRFPHSIGLLFSAITAYLGFQVNDGEWKVMGLAPYGKPRFLDRFREVVDMRPDGSFRLNMRYFAHDYSTRRMFNARWERLFGRPARKPESDLDEFHHDVAHSGQKVVEDLVLNLARALSERYRLPNLCIAGGVGLNCVANWRIHEETGFKNIFIQPAAGDSGGALGTAFHIANTLLGRDRVFQMRHAYWGPEYGEEAIRAALDSAGASYVRRSEEELLDETARRIASGEVIGWFQGRMELGPRALGARSILADPRDPRVKETINGKVKFREWFRPFAPAVLKERAQEYFEVPAGMDLPFMLMVPKVRPQHRQLLPGVTHEDGTGRVQTLTEDLNGRFYRLVRWFGELTGVPVVVNTSFNVRGEPIVCTPADAYRTFLNTGLDALVIGDFIVTEKPGSIDFEAARRRSITLEGTASPELREWPSNR
ncbi:MAG: carbamoyltransferase [Planctomycetes bacterium]|nr:carbamoyltransferase [Planctomycetota bacterium]